MGRNNSEILQSRAKDESLKRANFGRTSMPEARTSKQIARRKTSCTTHTKLRRKTGSWLCWGNYVYIFGLQNDTQNIREDISKTWVRCFETGCERERERGRDSGFDQSLPHGRVYVSVLRIQNQHPREDAGTGRAGPWGLGAWGGQGATLDSGDVPTTLRGLKTEWMGNPSQNNNFSKIKENGK